MHSEAIELIEAEVARVEVQLSDSGGNQELVTRKNSLMASLSLLRQMSAHKVTPKATIISLPLPQTHFSEYRIMADEESDDRSCWTELEIEGTPLTAIVGDILILNSEKMK